MVQLMKMIAAKFKSGNEVKGSQWMMTQNYVGNKDLQEEVCGESVKELWGFHGPLHFIIPH